MNPNEEIKKFSIAYDGLQNSILKYLTMREKMKKPIVTMEEIIEFFPHKISRKDNLQQMLKTMIKNNFIKEKNNGYIITNIGKHVPFVVASNHQKSQVENERERRAPRC